MITETTPAITETLTGEQIYFQQAKPASIRIWHWLTFIFFVASITMVLMSATMFKTRDNIAMVQDQVKEKGGTITHDQARNVAHEYNDKLWMVHKFIGYGLSFLLISRIVIEVVQAKKKRINSKIKEALKNPADREKTHYVAVQFSYLVFYFLFIMMATTGLVLAYEDVEWLQPVHEAAKQVHGILQYVFYAYIIGHIAGTVSADIGKYGGIISRMINGKDTVKQQV